MESRYDTPTPYSPHPSQSLHLSPRGQQDLAPGSGNGDPSNFRVNIADIRSETHGLDRREFALLTYTFGEPTHEANRLLVKVIWLIIVIMIVAAVFNPWIESWLSKKVENRLLRFSILLVVTTILIGVVSLLFFK